MVEGINIKYLSISCLAPSSHSLFLLPRAFALFFFQTSLSALLWGMSLSYTNGKTFGFPAPSGEAAEIVHVRWLQSKPIHAAK